MADDIQEERGPEGIPGGHRAAQSRDDAGAQTPGPTDDPAEGVLTLVCLTCGQEYYFADTDPQDGMTCERCGNGVFRNFFTPAEDDEVAQDFADTTDRDLDPDDAEGDTLPGDVIDLNRD